MEKVKKIEIKKIPVEIEAETSKACKINTDIENISEQEILLNIEVKPAEGKSLTITSLKITATVPVKDIMYVNPHNFLDYNGQTARIGFPWNYEEKLSCNFGSPLIIGYNRDGFNRFFMSFIDQRIDTIAGHINKHYLGGLDSYQSYYFLKRFFPGVKAKVFSWKDSVYFNFEDKKWNKIISKFIDFYDKTTGQKLANVTEKCLEPVWCSWYAYTNNSNEKVILENAKIAKEIGIGTILIDADWFHPAGTDFVEWTGGYVAEKTKFKDLKGLVKKIQEMGLNVVFWVAPLWLGKKAKNYSKYKYLKVRHGKEETRAICAMCEDSASYAGNLCGDIMRYYELDGLKIDFVDDMQFMAQCTAKHRHNVSTLGEGIDNCLKSLYDSVLSVKKDALIEFRQSYTNIRTRAYGNCFRATDSPYDFDQDRRFIILNRIFGKGIPVHADYAFWHKEESFENRAKFLASIIFGAVPTFSLRLNEMEKAELSQIKSWIELYKKYKDTLVFGEVEIISEDPHFSVSCIHGKGTSVVGIFGQVIPSKISLIEEDTGNILVLNAGKEDYLKTVFENCSGSYKIIVCDSCLSEILEKTVDSSEAGLEVDEKVPSGGVVEIKKL